MKRNILIIDDSPTVLNMLKAVLEKEGYEVTTAEKGEEGVEKAKKEEPDIVIIDTLLPDIEGFETCVRIRKEKVKKQPKIVVTTGSVDAVDAVKARGCGADDYCVKTSDFSHLVEIIKSLSD